ncbi:TPA_asm: replication initiator protein [Microviridae sp.]|nr:TPA_asm: replication initiator protein [Microviridae sp.]
MECINYQKRSGRVVRCNECIECLNYNRWIWTQRIKIECVNVKSWFLTLTYSGEEKEGYKDVQKMLKRLRKKYTFRFMCKSEDQKRGVCHYHLAVHGELTRREVESEWKFGFKNAKLMKSETQLAKYIAKYITKDSRKGKNYRASIRYGGLNEEITDNKMVKETMVHFPNSRIVKVFDPEVGSISLPWKYQYKNSPKQIKEFSKLGKKIRDHASMAERGPTNTETTTPDERKKLVDIMGGTSSLDGPVGDNKGGTHALL